MQRAVIAHLGQRALAGTDLDSLMDEAIRLAARTLGMEYAAVFEMLPDRTALRMRVGLGWRDGIVGTLTVPTGTESHAGFTLLARQPFALEDIEAELRFACAPHHLAHGVVSGISAVIGVGSSS